jgi:hypothetical protein
MYFQVTITATTDANLLSGAIQGYYVPFCGCAKLVLTSISYQGAATANKLIEIQCPLFKNIGNIYPNFISLKDTTNGQNSVNLNHLAIDLGSITMANYLYIRPIINGALSDSTFNLVLGFDVVT